MEKVALRIYLKLVQLGDEEQVSFGLGSCCGDLLLVSALLGSVECLPRTEGSAAGAADQQHRLFGANFLLGLGPHLFLREVPRVTVLVGGGEVEGESSGQSQTGEQLQCRRDSGPTVDLRHEVLKGGLAMPAVAVRSAPELVDEPEDLSVVLQHILLVVVRALEKVEHGHDVAVEHAHGIHRHW